jgi:Fe-S-cluster containining protein
MTTAAERYRELAARVDAFFAKVRARHEADMVCAPGCDACCRVRPTITRVEADEIRALVASLAAPERERLVARALAAGAGRCAALDDDGRCAVYAARPLVCRSHGVPVKLHELSLPLVSSCEKNFVHRGPSAADVDCILDQETLSTILHAIDAAHALERGASPGEREDLAAVISGRAAPAT